MGVRVNYQINNYCHHVMMESAEEAQNLIRNVFNAKLAGRNTFQLTATCLVELPALCWMDVGK